MTEISPDAGAPGAEWVDLPAEQVRCVQDLFVTLAKAFRAFQLYDENNPVRHRFVAQLREGFVGLWNDFEDLTLRVEEDRLVLEGQEVYRSESRNDSLSFLLFKDGIRDVTFLPGIEGDELERFLGVLQRARKLSLEGDDLITVLWEEDLQCFRYRNVDYLAEGVDLPAAGDGAGAGDLQRVMQSEVEEDAEEASTTQAGADGPQPKTVSRDDFNPTLYSLDPRELQTLRSELEKELRRDTRAEVLAALFDRLEEPAHPERQSRILGILGTLLPNFLSRGVLGPASDVLAELRRLEAEEGIFDEQRLDESRSLLDTLSHEETIGEVIRALTDGSLQTTPEQLSQFLQYLHASALGPLLRAAETTEMKGLQAVLRQAVQGMAMRNRSAVVALLGEQDAVVASGAARLAGDLQIAEAGPALANLLAHPEPSVRLAAVEAAVTLRASTAAGALQVTLDDPEREVRIAAAKALGELRYNPAAQVLERTVTGKEIRSADISEKVAFFEAYGVVAGEQAVELMDKLLNGKGFLGRREPAEIRAAAALALGKAGSPVARAALQRAAGDDDAVVRSAVGRALRGEEGQP